MLYYKLDTIIICNQDRLVALRQVLLLLCVVSPYQSKRMSSLLQKSDAPDRQARSERRTLAKLSNVK